LLGFQFVAFFNSAFTKLPPGLQMYHTINLVLTTFCAVLLIAPVAMRELRSNSRSLARWLRYTPRFISAAMFLLLVSMAGDVLVAGRLLSKGPAVLPAAASIAVFVFGAATWFGTALLSKR